MPSNPFWHGRFGRNAHNRMKKMQERGRKAIIRRLRGLGLTEHEAEEATGTLIEGICAGLEKDGKVLVSGFGRFSVRQMRPRQVKMPGQDRRRIPARLAVKFKAGPKVFQKLV